MEFPALKEAKGKLDAARKELDSVFTEAGKDLDFSQVKSLNGDNAEKLDWVRTKNEEIIALKGEVDKLDAIYGIASKRVDERSAHEEKSAGSSTENKSLGDLFVESAARKSWRRGVRESDVAFIDVGTKTLFETATGFPPESVRSGRVVDYATRPDVDVVTFIPQVSISQPVNVYMEETTLTNAAAETAEGGAFPEAALAYTERTQAVRKVAVHLPVTDEQLEDEALARTRVNMRIPFMLRQKLDAQVLNGSGAGTPTQLLGTKNVSGIQTQSATSLSLLDAIAKAFNKIRTTAFAEPSVLYIHPSDWEIVELLKDSDGNYIWGAPSGVGPKTAWGVPVKTTTVLTAGTAVTGDYANHSELAVKRGIDMQVTNSHDDYFVKGKQVVRADMRCVMTHYRPTAFATITDIAAA